VKFLSDEWIAAMDATARAVAAPTGLVVEQLVRDVPSRGDVRFHVVFAEAGARVLGGAAPRADVRLSSDYATAVALARGEINAQEALSHGRLRIVGDVNALVARSEALLALGDVFGRVRAATEYERVG